MSNSKLKNRTKRVLVKISGEFLSGSLNYGIDDDIADYVANEVRSVADEGIEICLVVGGGNFYRGSSSNFSGSERATADYMGMLATLINALSLQRSIENSGVSCRVLSAIPMQTICEPYIRRRAIRHLEKSRVVVFAAGTGNPFFTTDTAAVLRSIEMGCSLILKATKVNGVYSSDPSVNKDAIKYNSITYDEVLSKNLKVMDSAAIALAKDNNVPIVIFDLGVKSAMGKIINNEQIGTIIN